jgi:PPP family 3-phenylpropionic acid transporter
MVRPRLAVHYLALFGALGVSVPFWPLWLSSRGLGPDAIALVLGAGQWIRIVASPVVGAWVDRTESRKQTMIALGILSSLAFSAFAWADGLLAFVCLSALANAAFVPLIPLSDSLALARERSHGISYGSVRVWGSVAFILSSVGAGQLLGLTSVDVVLIAIVAFTVTTTLTSAALPDPSPRGPRPTPPPLRALLRRPAFPVFIIAAALAQASHSVYYAFATIHWEAAGHSSAVVGALWAEGVFAEVVLFIVGARLTNRFKPSTLIAFGAATGIVRWWVLGVTTALPAIAAAQLLHASTFGAVHLGAMTFLARRVPSGLSARAQTLYAAAVGGVAMGIAIPASGPLYRILGGGAFQCAAVLSGVAAVLAVVVRFIPDPAPGCADAQRRQKAV